MLYPSYLEKDNSNWDSSESNLFISVLSSVMMTVWYFRHICVLMQDFSFNCTYNFISNVSSTWWHYCRMITPTSKRTKAYHARKNCCYQLSVSLRQMREGCSVHPLSATLTIMVPKESKSLKRAVHLQSLYNNKFMNVFCCKKYQDLKYWSWYQIMTHMLRIPRNA